MYRGPYPVVQVQILEGEDHRLPCAFCLACEEHGDRLGCARHGEECQPGLDPGEGVEEKA